MNWESFKLGSINNSNIISSYQRSCCYHQSKSQKGCWDIVLSQQKTFVCCPGKYSISQNTVSTGRAAGETCVNNISRIHRPLKCDKGCIHLMGILVQQGDAPQFIHLADFYSRLATFKNLYIVQTFIPGWWHVKIYTSCTCLILKFWTQILYHICGHAWSTISSA